MDLSIIVPCHNLEKHIKNLLNSIDYQRDYTYSNVEIIFVLDDCTDATDKIISSWIDTAPMACTILYVNVHSCGLARNTGVEYAHGKYIWFVDGDDWLISNETFKTIFSWIWHAKDSEYLHILWSSNSYPIPTFQHTVWQWVLPRQFVQLTPFDAAQPSEDVRFLQKFFQRFPPSNIAQTKYPLYFYNYGREGSNMTQLAQKGHIDP